MHNTVGPPRGQTPPLFMCKTCASASAFKEMEIFPLKICFWKRQQECCQHSRNLLEDRKKFGLFGKVQFWLMCEGNSYWRKESHAEKVFGNREPICSDVGLSCSVDAHRRVCSVSVCTGCFHTLVHGMLIHWRKFVYKGFVKPQQPDQSRLGKSFLDWAISWSSKKKSALIWYLFCTRSGEGMR